MPSRALPFLVLGVGVGVVSFAAILIRFAQADGAPSLAIAAVRLAVAAAVLAPFAWPAKRAARREPRDATAHHDEIKLTAVFHFHR